MSSKLAVKIKPKQLQTIVNHLEEYPEMRSSNYMKQFVAMLWIELCIKLNKMGPPTRTVAGWKNVFSRYKNRLRSIVGTRQLTDLEKKVYVLANLYEPKKVNLKTTEAQYKAMVDYMTRVRGCYRKSFKVSRRQKHQMARILNKMGPPYRKSIGWSMVWGNLKRSTRLKVQRSKINSGRNPCGDGPNVQLTAMDKAILRISDVDNTKALYIKTGIFACSSDLATTAV